METQAHSHGKRAFCAEYSRAAGEAMAGTVRPVDLWLLVEYRAPWPRQAIAAFSGPVRERLGALLSRVPEARLALIRQPERNSGPLTAFWALAREHHPRLYRTSFDRYEELGFDIDNSGSPLDEKLFAVCTHGTHDLCCARFGNRIYAEMREKSANVWQVSHVGGCRFAPNVVCLPHGIVYGRVEPADCEPIVSSYERDAVLPAKLRGRSCFTKPVQAAEQLLRSARNWTALRDLTLAGVEQTGPRHWSVAFLSRDSIRLQVSLSADGGQTSTYKSCSAGEPSPREIFRLNDNSGNHQNPIYL